MYVNKVFEKIKRAVVGIFRKILKKKNQII